MHLRNAKENILSGYAHGARNWLRYPLSASTIDAFLEDRYLPDPPAKAENLALEKQQADTSSRILNPKRCKPVQVGGIVLGMAMIFVQTTSAGQIGHNVRSSSWHSSPPKCGFSETEKNRHSKPAHQGTVCCGFAIGGFVVITTVRESRIRKLLTKRLSETEKTLESKEENEILVRDKPRTTNSSEKARSGCRYDSSTQSKCRCGYHTTPHTGENIKNSALSTISSFGSRNQFHLMDNSSFSSLDSELRDDHQSVRLPDVVHAYSNGSRVVRTRTSTSLASSISRSILSVRQIVEQAREDDQQMVRTETQGCETVDLNEAIRIATNRSESIEPQEPEAESLPPVDTGYSWVICACVFLMMFATWGANGCYGVFLNHWLQARSFPGSSATDFALIGSIVLALAQALAPLAQMASAILGMKTVILAGVVFQTAGYLLASFATQLWQLYLTEGILVGLGFALVFNPAIVIFPEWFDKKRGLASGIIVSASGIAGVVFSLSSQAIISRTGSPAWAQRMLAIFSVLGNTFAACLLKHRIPTRRLRTRREIVTRFYVLFNAKVVKLPQVHFITLWFVLTLSCYIVALFSLSAYSTFVGLSSSQGSHVTAIFNGCQAIGRFSIGLAADYTGRVNMAVLLSINMVILLFAMWINATTAGVVYAYAILSGLTFGVASTLNQPLVADSVPVELFPSAWSYENFWMGVFSMFCEVVALKLRDMTLAKPFIKAQIFCGCFAAAGVLCLLPIREWKIRRMLIARHEALEALKEHEKHTAEYERRLKTYDVLLRGGFKAYMARLLYPVRT
ncbi:hypothetical protein KL923_001762 [Ogataea haglerorum]|nr:hypothetical protein KL923_001762 [Ogataea haglerorum]